MSTSDVKCYWLVPMEKDLHRVEFRQNMETTKASLSIDGKSVYTDVSKLCREELFNIGTRTLKIFYVPSRDDPLDGTYQLKIDETAFPVFRERQERRFARWVAHQCREKFHIVLDRNTLIVFVNREVVSSKHAFEGSDAVVSFKIELREGHQVPCRIVTPGNGTPTQTLYVRDEPWPLVNDNTPGIFPARQVTRGILTNFP